MSCDGLTEDIGFCVFSQHTQRSAMWSPDSPLSSFGPSLMTAVLPEVVVASQQLHAKAALVACSLCLNDHEGSEPKVVIQHQPRKSASSRGEITRDYEFRKIQGGQHQKGKCSQTFKGTASEEPVFAKCPQQCSAKPMSIN